MTCFAFSRLPAALLLAALLAAPASGQQPAPQRGGTLHAAVTAEPDTIDCHAAASFGVIHYVAPHYSLLLKVDQDSYPNIVGDVAESWTVSRDNLTYTFRLRPNIKFHNGTPLTSADVVASWERLRNPPEGVRSLRKEQFQGIAAITAPDARTIVFRLKEPNPSALTLFASPWNCIYSAAMLKEDPKYPEKTVMGSGPFKFVERVRGSHWVGARFDDYFIKGKPYLDGFRNTFMTSSAMITALQGGQIHTDLRGVTPVERDRLVQALGPKVKVQESPFIIMLTLAFNTERPPFNDIRVRRALTMAIDRWGGGETLGKTTLLRYAGGMVRPGSEYASTPQQLEKLPGFSRDMEKARAEARKLLAEAGVPNLSFKLAIRNIAQPQGPLGIYLVDQWRRIGVTVEQSPLETAAYFTTLNSGTFDVGVDSLADALDDPTLNLERYLSFDRSRANSSRMMDREVDRLFDLQRAEQDPAKRKQYVQAMEQRLIEQAYVAPLFWWQRIVVMSSNMQGWKALPSYLINQDYSNVWFSK